MSTPAHAILRNMNACYAAVGWVEQTSPRAGLGRAGKRLWDTCPDPEWLVWLIGNTAVRQHISGSSIKLRNITADLATETLPWLALGIRDHVQSALYMLRDLNTGTVSDYDLTEFQKKSSAASFSALEHSYLTYPAYRMAQNMVLHAPYLALMETRLYAYNVMMLSILPAVDRDLAGRSGSYPSSSAVRHKHPEHHTRVSQRQCEIIRSHISWAELSRAVRAADDARFKGD